MTARALLGLVALALAACDPVWVLEARITVPEGAQRRAGTYPQAVFLHYGESWDGVDIVVVLCEPTVGDHLYEVEISGLGSSGRPGTATAWLEPVPEEAGLPCGVIPFGEGAPGHEPPPWAWRADADAFEWGIGDRDGVILVLADPLAQPG